MANFYPDGAGPKDFFALVRLFGNGEHKEYVDRLEKALDGLADTSKKQGEEARRLAGISADLDAKRTAIELADAELAAYRVAFANEKATTEGLLAAAKRTNDAEREANVQKEGELVAKERALADREAALIEADRVSQESADRRAADLDAREQAIIEAERSLDERKAKFLAAKEALGD